MNRLRFACWSGVALAILLVPTRSDACRKATEWNPATGRFVIPMSCVKVGIDGSSNLQIAIQLGDGFPISAGQLCACGVSFIPPGGGSVPGLDVTSAKFAVVNFDTCMVDGALTNSTLQPFYLGGSPMGGTGTPIFSRQPGADTVWASGVDMMGNRPLPGATTWFGFGGGASVPQPIVPPDPPLPSNPNVKYAVIFTVTGVSASQLSSLAFQYGSGGGLLVNNVIVPNFTPQGEPATYACPEPPSGVMVALGIAGLGLLARWRSLRRVA